MPKTINFDNITPDVPENTPDVPAVPARAGEGNTSSSPGNTKKERKTKNSVPTVNPAIAWVFTLNNPNLPEDHNIIRNNPKIKEYQYQLERGESGTPHFQGFLRFYSKARPKSIIPDTRIHWEVMRGSVAENRIYCSKNDDVIEGPWYKGIRPTRPKCSINESILYPWQKELEEQINKTPDDRTIMWYWEPDGKMGKTQFSKYLTLKYECLFLTGKAGDMKFAVANYVKTNGDPWLIIINAPRSNTDYISYGGIEEIKDGIFFSGKYESEQCIYPSPHILIFANEEPKIDKLSADRWKIVRVPPAAESSA